MATRWFRDGNWWAAVAGGAIAFPVAVLLHELGHFMGYTAFGFPDPVLHYGSAGWADEAHIALLEAGDLEAAAAIAQPWQEAVAGALGPIVSYLTLIACVLAVRRYGPGPLSAGPRRRAGDPPALAAGDTAPCRKARRSAVDRPDGRGEAGGAHGHPGKPSPCSGCRGPRAGIPALRHCFPARRESASDRPDAAGALAVGGPSGCCGWGRWFCHEETMVVSACWRRDRRPLFDRASRTRAFCGVCSFPIFRRGAAVLLSQLDRQQRVQATLAGRRSGSRIGRCSTLAGGCRRSCRSDCLLLDGHRLRVCGPSLRPRAAFPCAWTRIVGAPARLGSIPRPRRRSLRWRIQREPGRCLGRTARRDFTVRRRSPRPRLPPAELLVPGHRLPAQTEVASPRAATARHGCGWLPVDPVAGAAGSSVKTAHLRDYSDSWSCCGRRYGRVSHHRWYCTNSAHFPGGIRGVSIPRPEFCTTPLPAGTTISSTRSWMRERWRPRGRLPNRGRSFGGRRSSGTIRLTT